MAALILGKWFDSERKKLMAQRKPWYAPWLSIPGILIILIICMFLAIRQFFSVGM
ncbi:MAG: hypothetical protein KJ737_13245 [Proteobacteria bacterium]|nr:hypothetical protein [Pseudomonadota bacterium]